MAVAAGTAARVVQGSPGASQAPLGGSPLVSIAATTTLPRFFTSSASATVVDETSFPLTREQKGHIEDDEAEELVVRRTSTSAADDPPDVLDTEQLILLGEHEKAWNLFHEKIAAKDAHTRDCNIMLSICDDSKQMWHHIDVTMRAAGVLPDVVTFTHLVRQLVVEGRKDAARNIVDEVMPAFNVRPNRRTRSTLAMSEHDAQRIRRARERSRVAKAAGENGVTPANDMIAVQDFEKMLREKHHKKAWRQFRAKLRKSRVTLLECNMMMKGCFDSEQMRAFMERDMRETAGIEPNVITYTTLLRELILEGDAEGARRIVDDEMPKHGVAPDDKTWSQLYMKDADVDRLRGIKIKNLLRIKHSDGFYAAMNFVYMLIERGRGNLTIKHCNMIVRELPDSSAMREFMESTMWEAGLYPDAYSFNLLVGRLLIECKDEEALRVVNTEMPAAGIQPYKRTLDLLEMAPGVMGRMRTHVLNQLMVKEGPEFEKGRDHLMSQISKDKTKVDVTHFNIMLKACDSSEEMRMLIGTTMKDAGVKPSVATYGMLVRQLMVEGDAPAARAVVYEEMPAAGVAPNRRVRDILDMSSNDLGRLRMANLMSWLEEGSKESLDKAWDLFDKLDAHGEANVYIYTTMLRCCHGSDQMRAFIEVTMKKAGVEPDLFAYTTLVKKLIAEEKITAARNVLEKDILAAGLEPDVFLKDLMHRLAKRR